MNDKIPGIMKLIEIDLPKDAVLDSHACCDKYWLLVYQTDNEFIPIIINLESLTWARVVNINGQDKER